MYDFFDRYKKLLIEFEGLLTEAKADMLEKLEKNQKYKENLIKHRDNYFELMKIQEDENVPEKYKKLVWDFMQTNNAKQYFEEAAMYIRGFSDCAALFSKSGDSLDADLAEKLTEQL